MKNIDAKQQIDRYFEDYKRDLARLVAAKSVRGAAEKNAPFGAGVRDVLDAMMDIASNLGFTTFADPEGYYGYAEIGAGKEIFGVLGHLDVVPVEPVKSWHTDPFTLTEKDGRLYGRGTQDDKGPTLAAMYALKILVDNGAELDRRVRFIFGTDEESFWGGIKTYVKKEELPSLGFTPDSGFPLIYAEKGLINYELTANEKTDAVLSGGTAYNAVPAEATTPYDEAVESALMALGYEYESDKKTLTVIGKTVHASDAENGVNAVVRLATAMQKAGKENAMIRFIAEMGCDPNGVPIYGEVSDADTGKMTFNIGVAKLERDSQMIGIDMRTPASLEKEKSDAGIEAAAKKYGIEVKPYDYLRPIHIDVDSELVKKLMQAYAEVTGDSTSKPETSGGATFARAMDNIVAFGAVLPGHVETEHQLNEYAVIDDLKTAMAVYMRAFELLVVK